MIKNLQEKINWMKPKLLMNPEFLCKILLLIYLPKLKKSKILLKLMNI
jgi:hypothetical protein